MSRHSRRAFEQALRRAAPVVFGVEVSAERDLPSLPWAALRYHDLERVKVSLAEAGYAAGTINLTLAGLRGVLRHCRKLRLLSPDDFEDLREVRRVRGSGAVAGRALSSEEVASLFAAAEGLAHPIRERDLALLALAFSTGARRSEISALDLVDYQAARPSIRIRSGKGGRDRVAFMTLAAAIHVETWLEVRGSGGGALLQPIRSNGRILARRLSAGSAYGRFQRLSSLAGIGRLTPHDARRTVATSMLAAGVDVVTTARQTGHSSLEVLRASYDRRGEESVRQAVASSIAIPA